MTRKEILILVFSILQFVMGGAFISLTVNMAVFSYLSLWAALMVLSIALYLLMCIMIAMDIKEKGISWAYMVLPILLAGAGGILYWLMNRGRGKKPRPSAIPAKEPPASVPGPKK